MKMEIKIRDGSNIENNLDLILQHPTIGNTQPKSFLTLRNYQPLATIKNISRLTKSPATSTILFSSSLFKNGLSFLNGLKQPAPRISRLNRSISEDPT